MLLAEVSQPRQTISDEEIIARMMIPMINEVVRCPEEKIVASPAEADMALVYGIGFPPFHGGAFRYRIRSAPPTTLSWPSVTHTSAPCIRCRPVCAPRPNAMKATTRWRHRCPTSLPANRHEVIKMENVVIVDAVRTPMGRSRAAPSAVRAEDLRSPDA